MKKLDGVVPVAPTPFPSPEESAWAAWRGLVEFARAGEFFKLTVPRLFPLPEADPVLERVLPRIV